ncbi:HAD-IC family P-type ATPase [Brevundimonas sp.]|uniref:HAD-IC family P-type ATPase n=1 Tax=Brevundimonas sp. TaxID=1871086 RepID=UPI002CF810BF|nr:HAD-IC family P-type ATPase [Brevundimonas sp.]HWQ87007.1 HAD-IC family P-type ATPase [Brevundimonas sp.]
MTFTNPEHLGETRRAAPLAGGLSGPMLGRAVGDAFVKLDPRKLLRNPVIFTTWIVALLATVSAIAAVAAGEAAGFAIQLAVWLWATVLFANIAESVAEGRGKAAADSLRATRVTTKAKLIVDPKTGLTVPTPAGELEVGSIVLVEAGDVIPSDGEIVEGIASVNEAAITGESAPVIRESGGDRSAVTGGTTVVSDWIKVRITSAPGSTFLDRMISMVEGANRRKTPNELALSVLLAGLTLVFLIAVVTLLGLGAYSGITLDPIVLGALFITLIPTTIGGLLSAVGIARSGGTPLAVVESGVIVGIIHLKDVIKPGMKERFADLRRMGLRTVMITGDNPVTAAAIASEAGVDDYLAEATPEDKMRLIKAEQAKGRLVAMCGDGANDAPALAQADVGVAMQTGAQAAREAGNMVDLDSDPTKVIEIVEVGKQLLITRGALTTFSIANDLAKYFAIIPAMFVVALPALGALNVMGLHSPESAILSAVIFNALVIVALIPLALRGVKYRAIGAGALLSRNLLIYGLGGLVAPFVGIKLIDVVISGLGLA